MQAADHYESTGQLMPMPLMDESWSASVVLGNKSVVPLAAWGLLSSHGLRLRRRWAVVLEVLAVPLAGG